MELTPNEIRNHQFSSAMRGFNRSEVEAFKEVTASALEEAKVEILKLSEEKISLESRYNDLKNLEETLKTTIIEAQKGAEQIVTNAKKEAELIIADARQKRDTIIEEKHQQITKLDAKLREIEFVQRSFYNKLRAEIEGHLKLVDQIAVPSGKEMAGGMPKLRNSLSLDKTSTGNFSDGEGSKIDRFVEQFRNRGEKE